MLTPVIPGVILAVCYLDDVPRCSAGVGDVARAWARFMVIFLSLFLHEPSPRGVLFVHPFLHLFLCVILGLT